MKLVIMSCAVAVVAALGAAAPVAAATAGTDKRPCVSEAEFAQVKKGMAVGAVHKVFDTAGKREAISSAGGFTVEIRSYKACTAYGAVSVGYQNGKLSSKSAVF